MSAHIREGNTKLVSITKSNEKLNYTFERLSGTVSIGLSHEEFEDWLTALEIANDEEEEKRNVFEPRSKKRAKRLLKRLRKVHDEIGTSPELSAQSQRAMEEIEAMISKPLSRKVKRIRFMGEHK